MYKMFSYQNKKFSTRHPELVSGSEGVKGQHVGLNTHKMLKRVQHDKLTTRVSFYTPQALKQVQGDGWRVQNDEVKVKSAFTLAEVMIVLAVIGILVAILLPTAQNLTPDKAVLKFKKGNVSLTTAIRDLANSDAYFYDGDFGLDRDGNRIENAKYFCNALGDVLTTKKVECSDDDLGYNSTALANLPNIETDEIDGIKIYEYVDCMCKNNTTSGEEIILNDNTIIYTINPAYHFGSLTQDPDATEQKRLFNLCSNEKRYKFICLDIDGQNQGEDPFGYALRADGKIIYGARAQAWIKTEINNNELPAISTTDTCAPITLSIIPEPDSCKPTYSSGTTIIEKTCTLSEHCADCSGLTGECTACEDGYKLQDGTCIEISFECSGENFMAIDELNLCVTRKNMGDSDVLQIPDEALVVKVQARKTTCDSEKLKCCWYGTTADNCDSANGGYSGCTRTVCNYDSAEAICANFNYGGKIWRLPSLSEAKKMGNFSIGLGKNGLMFCDHNNDEIEILSAQCSDWDGYYCYGAIHDDYCNPGDMWTSTTSGSNQVYSYWLDNNEFGADPYEKGYAFSVRCVSDL